MRLELYIDVLDKKNQKALVEEDATSAELVTAILEEFRELEYLSNTPDDYQLLKDADSTPLAAMQPLREQVTPKSRLILAEVAVPLPDGTHRPTKPIYLREDTTGQVYKIHWYPAIIGRPGSGLADNEWIAVNLREHAQGSRVSRRHAQITEDAGDYYIEPLSQNQTTIESDRGVPTLLDGTRYRLQPGDIIHLGQQQIALKFLMREEEGAA